MKKQRSWSGSSVFMTLVVAGLALVGLITCFGDSVRRLFGMSGDALAGNDNVALRASPPQSKRMVDFGGNEAYGAPPAAPSGVYAPAAPSPVVDTRADRLSTFAIDVDTASYTRAREQILNERHGGPRRGAGGGVGECL